MSAAVVFDVVGTVVVLIGALVFASASLGIVRFPDVYTRVSAVGTAGGLGIIMVITGALLHQPSVPNLVKVIIIIGLQLGTSAIGTMAIARSSYLSNVRMNPGYYDDLAEDTERRRRRRDQESGRESAQER